MELFAGIDAGGTKTECVLTDGEGRFLGRGFGGPANHLWMEKSAAGRSVSDSVERAFANAGLSRRTLRGAYFGSCSIATGKGESHLPFYGPFIDAEALLCDGDLTCVWYGAAAGREAVVLIAGTGAIAMRFPADAVERLRAGKLSPRKVSGWGPVLGDEGSGYDMGLRAVRAALRMADGRLPADWAFLDAVCNRARETASEEARRKLEEHPELEADAGLLLFARYQNAQRSDVAAVAPVVTALADRKNATACAIVADIVGELACAAAAAARMGGGQALPVCAGGGLLRPELPVAGRLCEAMRAYPELGALVRPAGTAAGACAALALQAADRLAAAKRVLQQKL